MLQQIYVHRTLSMKHIWAGVPDHKEKALCTYKCACMGSIRICVEIYGDIGSMCSCLFCLWSFSEHMGKGILLGRSSSQRYRLCNKLC